MRSVRNFPGYKVTRDGRVWPDRSGRWLSPGIGSHGYPCVSLCRGGKATSICVHRLVLESFIGPRPKGMEACHNNGDREDNRLENLRWGTRVENADDKRRHGTLLGGGVKGENCHLARLSKADVTFILYALQTGLVTQTEIANAFGVRQTAISNIVTKRTWKHIWRAKHAGAETKTAHRIS